MTEAKKLGYLIVRNLKLYFKDKGIFFASLITPLILVVLFLTFLGNVYESSLTSVVSLGLNISSDEVTALLGQNAINSFTGSWLFSSIMATSCVTVAFCSNMMVIDKVNKAKLDFDITPVKRSTLQISYTLANFISTAIICLAALVVSFVYLAIVGWFLSFVDILMIIVNMVLLIMFGSLLSSIIGLFISSSGAVSAVCTLVSSMYGFLCGAYMPISGFGKGIQCFVGFIPGTYGTVLFRQYYMRGVLDNFGESLPSGVIDAIRQGFDGTYYFFDNEVSTLAMFLIMIGSIVLLSAIYILLSYIKGGYFSTHKHRIKKKAQSTK